MKNWIWRIDVLMYIDGFSKSGITLNISLLSHRPEPMNCGWMSWWHCQSAKSQHWDYRCVCELSRLKLVHYLIRPWIFLATERPRLIISSIWSILRAYLLCSCCILDISNSSVSTLKASLILWVISPVSLSCSRLGSTIYPTCELRRIVTPIGRHLSLNGELRRALERVWIIACTISWSSSII